MTKKNSTKRVLVASILTLCMCFTMLIGTTFAWFTDSATSSGNVIKTGTLDVEMYWANGKADPADTATTWTDATTGPIFNNDKWEPGYTEVRHIKIENKGSLALKYAVKIIPNGTVSELADVIDVYYADPAVQIADASALTADKKLGTLTEALAGLDTTGTGNLAAGKADTITIAFKMQDDAGNEYQNLSIGTDFSIQILATQLTSESDSFGDQYDADAVFGTYIELDDGADLMAALASAKANMPLTVKLNGNVEWPTEGHHGENDVTPASSILIDGNGYTITATGSGVTPIGDATAPMTLKNVTIVDNSVSYNEGAWEFTYLEMGGTSLNCENVTFADEIQTGTNATFTNCSFESNEESVYAVWVEDGSATFTNCTFTGCRGLKTHEAYGTEVSSVIVKGCTFSDLSKKPGIALGTLNADTTVSITDSTFVNCQPGDQALYIYETDTDVSTFNFTNENNTVYKNAKFVGTAAEIIALGGTNAEGTIILTDDIDLGGAAFAAIGAAYGKELTIVGNGHKISNATTAHTSHNGMKHHGLFYAYTDSTLTISDLVIENITIDATADTERNYGAGIVVSYADGGSTVILNNVDVYNCNVLNDTPDIGDEAGVYVGYQTGTLIMKDCDSIGCTVKGETAEKTGAMIGMVNGTATLTNCTTDLTIGTCNRVAGTLTEN